MFIKFINLAHCRQIIQEVETTYDKNDNSNRKSLRKVEITETNGTHFEGNYYHKYTNLSKW